MNTKWFLASSIADGNVNAEVEMFQAPSFGRWQSLFREVCRAISSSESISPPPLVAAITKFYQARVPGGIESEVYAAYRKVSEMYGLEPDKKLSNGGLFGRLVDLRNKIQAHGALQAHGCRVLAITGAVVHVVGADHRARKLLHQVALFIGALRR